VARDQAGKDLALEHRGHLAVGPGQQGQRAAPDGDELSGGRAVGVGKDRGALQHLGLTAVLLGNGGHAPARELAEDDPPLGRVEAQRAAQGGRRSLAREVVEGRAEPPADDHGVGRGQRARERGADFGDRVGDRLLAEDLEAGAAQARRQPGLVRVDLPGQELAADADQPRRRRPAHW
jgi:hypothetical protein